MITIKSITGENRDYILYVENPLDIDNPLLITGIEELSLKAVCPDYNEYELTIKLPVIVKDLQ